MFNGSQVSDVVASMPLLFNALFDKNIKRILVSQIVSHTKNRYWLRLRNNGDRLVVLAFLRFSSLSKENSCRQSY